MSSVAHLGRSVDRRLDRVGAAATALLLSPRQWIHRRVESIEFLDDTTVRRHISVDFTVPTLLLEALSGWGRNQHLVPLALLAKNPLIHFDLRDEAGSALPLPTRAENSRVAAAALIYHASVVLNEKGRTLEPEIVADLRAIADGPRPEAQKALDRALINEGPARVNREILAKEPRMRTLMTDLADNFIVLGRIDARRRRVLKFAYDEVLRDPTSRPPLTRRAAQGLGWRTKEIVWRIPSVGFSSSYHFEVVAPRDLEVVESTLVARDRRGIDYSRKVGPSGMRSHIYREGLPQDTQATASVLLRARRSGLLRSSALLGLLTAALLTLGALHVKGVEHDPAASITLLVLVPALLAAYLARPGEHELVSTILIGVRSVVLLTGLLAVAAAGSLLLRLSSSAEDTAFWTMAGLGWVAAAVLGLAYVLPRSNTGKMRETP